MLDEERLQRLEQAALTRSERRLWDLLTSDRRNFGQDFPDGQITVVTISGPCKNDERKRVRVSLKALNGLSEKGFVTVRVYQYGATGIQFTARLKDREGR